MSLLKSVVHRLGHSYVNRVTRLEADSQRFSRHNERPHEYAFVFRQVGRLCPQTILDVGTGTTALPALLRTCGCVVTATDNVRDYWPEGMVNRHWYVRDDNISKTCIEDKFNMVTCISVIEHIDNHEDAFRSMISLLSPGGHLVLTCPFTDDRYVADCYREPGARAGFRDLPYIGQSFSRVELDGWLGSSGATIVEAEYWRTNTGPFHGQGEWCLPSERATRETPHQHACFLIQRG